MKKTWIKIKRGLLTPEHREKLGVRVWLYMYIVDRADWETGTVYGWKDKDEAQDFGMPWRTLQQQRQQLEADGYITCQQQPYHQNIIINNWTNPREYSGQIHNPIYGGTESYVPTGGDKESGINTLNPEGTIQGTIQGTNQSYRKPSTPTYDSQVTDQMSGNIGAELSAAFVNETQIPELTGGPPRWFKAIEDMTKAGVTPDDVVAAVKEMRRKSLVIASLTSVVNPSIIEMSKRKSKSAPILEGSKYVGDE